MAHVQPEMDIRDTLGKTIHYSGTVGLTSALVPPAIGDKLGSVIVRNPQTNGINTTLKVAFDGGTTYITLGRGEFVGWYPKNNASGTPITQIRILGSVAATNYEIIADFEV
jgi:hypothetical protein